MKSSVLQHRLAHIEIGILIFIGILALGDRLVMAFAVLLIGFYLNRVNLAIHKT